MANCTPESSSDEELFILPPPKQKSFNSPMPSVNGHVAPLTLKQPAKIRQINGKSSGQAEPRSFSSPVKPGSPIKKIAISPALEESSSEDEPIVVSPKKKKYQNKKKRTRKKQDGDYEEAVTPKKKRAKKTDNGKTTKKKAKATKTKAARKPKKVYELPGQKKDTPHELDGGRIFYESLRKQIPTSMMAEEYLIRHGLLPKEEAEKIVERMEEAKLKKSGKKSGSTKTSATKGRRTNSNSSRSASKSKKKGRTTSKRSKKGSKGTGSRLKKKRKKTIEIMSGESSDDEPLMLHK